MEYWALVERRLRKREAREKKKVSGRAAPSHVADGGKNKNMMMATCKADAALCAFKLGALSSGAAVGTARPAPSSITCFWSCPTLAKKSPLERHAWRLVNLFQERFLLSPLQSLVGPAPYVQFLRM